MKMAAITHKNRDRRGGHKVRPVQFREGPGHVAPKMKAYVKRHTMKLTRRAGRATIASELVDEVQHLQDSDAIDQIYWDEGEPFDFLDSNDDWCEWASSSSCYIDEDDSAMFDGGESVYTVVISQADVGKTISQLMEEKGLK